MQNLQKKIYFPQLDFISDSYSIGMTCLEASVLRSSQELYDFVKFQINYNKMIERVGLISKNYSPFFQKCIQNMLQPNKDNRAFAEDILAILSPYQFEIQNFQAFVPSKRQSEEAVKKISNNERCLDLLDEFFDQGLSFQPSNFSKSKLEQKREVSKIPTESSNYQESRKYSRIIQHPRDSQNFHKHQTQTVQKPFTPATRQQQYTFSGKTGYVKNYNNPSYSNVPNTIPVSSDMTQKKIQRNLEPKKIVFTPSNTSYQKIIETNYQHQGFYNQPPPPPQLFPNQPNQYYINQKSYMSPSYQYNQGMPISYSNQLYGNQGFQGKQVFVSNTPKVQGQQIYLSAYNPPKQNQPYKPQSTENNNLQHPMITGNFEKEGKNEQIVSKNANQNMASIYNQKIYFDEKQTQNNKNENKKRSEFQGEKFVKQGNYKSEYQISKQQQGTMNKLIIIKPILETNRTQTKNVTQGNSEMTPQQQYELQKRFKYQQ